MLTWHCAPVIFVGLLYISNSALILSMLGFPAVQIYFQIVGRETPHRLEGQFGPPGPSGPPNKIDEIQADFEIDNKQQTTGPAFHHFLREADTPDSISFATRCGFASSLEPFEGHNCASLRSLSTSAAA